MTEIIEVKNLLFEYPNGFRAIDGVNLSIKKGEVIAIVGQNGSGKTTLVRHFNRLLKPTRGEVLVEGMPTDNATIAEVSRKVGYVFQNPNHQLFCKTVMEELEVGPNNFKLSVVEKKKNINETIDLLELTEMMDKHPLTLDYTSKKILTIASILTFNPEVVIMDEPTGGLDEEGRILLSKIIKKLKSQGHTVIMISHDMDFVAENVERVVVMAHGKILCDSVVSEAFSNAEIMKNACIEPPQITQLSQLLSNNKVASLSVEEFVKSKKTKGDHKYGNENICWSK